MYVEAFIGGNLRNDQCTQLYQTFTKGLNSYKNYDRMKKVDWNKFRTTRILKLPANQDTIFTRVLTNKNEGNCAILKHYQCEEELDKSYNEGFENLFHDPHQLGDLLPLYNQIGERKVRIKEMTVFMWLETWLGQEFYNELRTEQQHGYVVNSSVGNYNGRPGMNFVVQSDCTEPNNLSKCINEF